MTRLAYVLAASHSGSTLLTRLLASHPRICTVGQLELKAATFGDVSRYRCSCGSPIATCDFWSDARDRMRALGFAFDVTDARLDFRAAATGPWRLVMRPLHRGRTLEFVRDGVLSTAPGWRRRIAELQARNAAIARVICETSGADMIVDCSKSSVRLKFLLRNPDLDVRVVRLIRDARGVALALMNPVEFADARDPRFRADGLDGTRRTEQKSAREAAHEWVRSNEEAAAVIRTLAPDRSITVRYEELCASPGETLARLFDFLQVPGVPSPLLAPARPEHIVGNGMRFDRAPAPRCDERWRDVLAIPERAAVEAVAGPLNRSYGYV